MAMPAPIVPQPATPAVRMAAITASLPPATGSSLDRDADFPDHFCPARELALQERPELFRGRAYHLGADRDDAFLHRGQRERPGDGLVGAANDGGRRARWQHDAVPLDRLEVGHA